jgi:hypothetical protein
MNPRTRPAPNRRCPGETARLRTSLAASRTAVAEASLAVVLVRIDLDRHAIVQVVGSVTAAIVSLLALVLPANLMRIRFVAAGAVLLAIMVLAQAVITGGAAPEPQHSRHHGISRCAVRSCAGLGQVTFRTPAERRTRSSAV